MPLYDFQCMRCQHLDERFFKIENCPKGTICTQCGFASMKVIIPGHGGYHSETPAWLDDSVRNALQGDDEAPITTRSEYKRALKEKNVEPIERGHRNLRMI